VTDRGDTELVFPTSRVTIDYVEERRFLRWRWPVRIRRTFTFRALPVDELISQQQAIEQFQKRVEGAGQQFRMSHMVAVIVGPVAFLLPGPALTALWDAHCEANQIPKGLGQTEEPSASAPSSDGSSDGPST
jgi:hypothetical protein